MCPQRRASLIPPSGRNGSALLVGALPQSPSDGRFRVRLLSACGAAARPFGDAFYMLEREDEWESTAVNFPAPALRSNSTKAGQYFL